MVNWRITKYNPKYRDKKDIYQKNEWTSCHDIGKSYDGKEFTVNDYMNIEDAYVRAVLSFMRAIDIKTLTVKCLEKNGDSIKLSGDFPLYTKEMIDLFQRIHDENIIESSEVELLCRLILREQLWCKLESENMFIHFGYDYYMYIGCFSKPKSVINLIEEDGLFIEKMKSPYFMND